MVEAYGWPADLSDDEIRLLDMNREHAAEEARGLVRWLRPEYQNPQRCVAQAKGQQGGALHIGLKNTTEKAAWPKFLPEQIDDLQAALGKTIPE